MDPASDEDAQLRAALGQDFEDLLSLVWELEGQWRRMPWLAWRDRKMD